MRNITKKSKFNLMNKYKMMRKLYKQRGLTLTEVGLAVAVSGIIIVVGLSVYSVTNKNAKTLSFNTSVSGIRSAMSQSITDGITVSSISDLDLATTSDPWGGNYTVATVTGGGYAIGATNTPADASFCTSIVSYWTPFTSIAPVCASTSPGSVTLTFND